MSSFNPTEVYKLSHFSQKEILVAKPLIGAENWVTKIELIKPGKIVFLSPIKPIFLKNYGHRPFIDRP